jgi:hypothetical protein
MLKGKQRRIVLLKSKDTKSMRSMYTAELKLNAKQQLTKTELLTTTVSKPSLKNK